MRILHSGTDRFHGTLELADQTWKRRSLRIRSLCPFLVFVALDEKMQAIAAIYSLLYPLTCI